MEEMVAVKVATAKETYEALMTAKEFQWEKKLLETESENEKKIVKVLNESFNQNQKTQKEANYDKESIIRIYQGQQTNDQKIISELKRKIMRLEERSISPLRSLGNFSSGTNSPRNIPESLKEDSVHQQNSVDLKRRFSQEKEHYGNENTERIDGDALRKVRGYNNGIESQEKINILEIIELKSLPQRNICPFQKSSL